MSCKDPEYRRIRRLDGNNWVTEEFRKGGGVTNRGYDIKDRWVINGYFNRLRHIPQSLIDTFLADHLECCDIEKNMKAAEASCIEAMKEIIGQVEPRFLEREIPPEKPTEAEATALLKEALSSTDVEDNPLSARIRDFLERVK